MSKDATGYVKYDKNRKRYRSRISFTDESGKRQERYAYRKTRAQADDALTELREEIRNPAPRDALFSDLADAYSAAKIIPAEYIDGRKVAGRRSLSSAKSWLKTLCQYFGAKRVREIRHADIEGYKRNRLKVRVPGDRERSIAALNRELEFFRSALNWGVTNRYLEKNPFRDGPNLIDKSAEKSRDRWPGFGEEMAILAQCVGEGPQGREHLRPIVICLADTGLRQSELLTLDWSDIDLEKREINLRAINAKTNRVRTVPMTDRVHVALSAFPSRSGAVFPARNVSRSFSTAVRLAGIKDLKGHDLRHAFVTRGILAGVPQAMVLKASGHLSEDEWKRYLNIEPAQMRRMFEPVSDDQKKEDIKAYAREVMGGLKRALIPDDLADLLADL